MSNSCPPKRPGESSSRYLARVEEWAKNHHDEPSNAPRPNVEDVEYVPESGPAISESDEEDDVSAGVRVEALKQNDDSIVNAILQERRGKPGTPKRRRRDKEASTPEEKIV